MIPKSGYRFSEKIMLNKAVERDDDSKKNHPALARYRPGSSRKMPFGGDDDAGP
jgi:hypothetical protein